MKRNDAQFAAYAVMYGSKNVLRSLWYAYKFYRVTSISWPQSIKLALYDVSFRW